MLRKNALLAAAALVIGLALLAGYLARPITIRDGSQMFRLRGLVGTVGQALSAAGVAVDPADQVMPGLSAPVPLNGQITLRRAVQALVDDAGQRRWVTGYDRAPAALLAGAGIPLDPADRLLLNGLPLAPQAELPAGQPLVLQIVRAQTLVLDLNGQRRKLTSAAVTTAGALWEAGVRLGPGDVLSVPAGSRPIPNGVVAYRAAQPLTIRAGGQTLRARSTAATVGQALAAAGVALQGLDYARPAEDQPLPPDGQIQVVRVRETIALHITLLPYERQTTPDPNLDLDQRQVTRPGQYGVNVVRERARFEDDHEISRAVDSDWVANEPAAEIVGVGTKVSAKAVDSGDGPIEYWRAIQVYATSYSPCTQTGNGSCSYSTSSGIRLGKGIIAVTHAWYRIIAGLRVFVPGYGTGVIADVGGGIPGTPWIDLGFDEDSFATQAFTGWTTLYFLTPAPDNVSWTLP